MYVIELTVRYSPLPLSVQRKELADAKSLYREVCAVIEKAEPKLFSLSCEKVLGKEISVVPKEIVAVQIYEKTAAMGSVKRPGFSFEA